VVEVGLLAVEFFESEDGARDAVDQFFGDEPTLGLRRACCVAMRNFRDLKLLRA
jgi:hypothetical protein